MLIYTHKSLFLITNPVQVFMAAESFRKGYVNTYFMLMTPDCAAVTHCEKCNELDDKIKCVECKTGFSLQKNNTCQGIALELDAT